MADVSKKNDIYNLLHGVQLETIVEKRENVVLKDSDPVEKAVNVLSKNKFLSAPVVDGDSNCLGAVDMLDIVHFVISVAPDPLALKQDELQSLEISGRAMAFAEVKEIVNASGRDAFVPVYNHNPLTVAVELFSKGVHRIPLVDNDRKVTHTISQSDINRFLVDKLDRGKCKQYGDLTAKEVGLGQQSKVITVKLSDTVLSALTKINKQGVSAVAVVNDDGQLAGNFSATDLKGLYKESFPSFLLTVDEYLEKHSPDSKKPICATLSTKVIDIVKEFATSHVHRLWVLGEGRKPTGVISLTDIMGFIVNFHLTAATTHKD
eukprot:TRINITY_DN290_c0_g1_i1.p1 TRINITY_DN290_c0_g1~~TRINITY_DN290_c0_g1_i1.p1  ORF type:complete len:320 (+),score=59.25 TRINITY_DN290_c0_g1_i1:98-1057(+)